MSETTIRQRLDLAKDAISGKKDIGCRRALFHHRWAMGVVDDLAKVTCQQGWTHGKTRAAALVLSGLLVLYLHEHRSGVDGVTNIHGPDGSGVSMAFLRYAGDRLPGGGWGGARILRNLIEGAIACQQPDDPGAAPGVFAGRPAAGQAV